MSSEKTNNSRRDFLVKSMALIPTVDETFKYLEGEFGE